MKKFAKFLLSLVLVSAVLLSPLTVSAVEFDPGLELHSAGAVLVSLDTGDTVFAKEGDTRMEPASVTKIIVALLLMENVHNLPETTVTAPDYVFDLLAGTNSSVSGIRRGETLTAEQLLYCLLVPSGNDAAMVIADYLGNGNISAFVDMMNRRAQEIGCTNTHFANPHGLHDPNHYTTPNDMAKITQYILNSQYKDEFMKVCKTTSYSLAPDDKRDTVLTLNTTNNMQLSSSKYYYKYTEGIKTGSTEEAGFCLVSTAYNANVDARYLCVTFGAPMFDENGEYADNGAMMDHKALYEWAFNNLRYKQVVSAKQTACEIKLNYAWEKDTIQLLPESDFNALLLNDIQPESVVLLPNDDVPESVDAPVQKGQRLGTANVTYAGMTLGTVNLVASESVEASQLLLLKERGLRLLHSKWLKIGGVVFAVLLVIYIVISVVYNVRAKKRRRRHSSLNGRGRY